MPLTPNALERLVLLRLNRGPGPVLDLVGGAGERAVGLALDLGVFDALADGPATAAELAPCLDCAPDGLAPLLGFLAALGYLSRDDDRYANTAMTEAWLLDSPDSVAPWLAFWDDVVFPFWDEQLETASEPVAPAGRSTSGSTRTRRSGGRPTRGSARPRASSHRPS